MKKKYILFSALLSAFITFQKMNAGSMPCWDTAKSSIKKVNFKRKFKKSKSEFSKTINTNVANKETPIEIVYNDFLDHLSLNKSRIGIVHDGLVNMDIGYIDAANNELWVLPNLKDLNAAEVDVFHVTPESSGIVDELYNQDYVVNATHAIHVESTDIYQIFGLDEENLFLYGLGEIDEFDDDEDGDYEDRIAINWFGTQSPIPLKLGVSYESKVTFKTEDYIPFSDDDEYSAIDSVQYKDIYRVIGQGVLRTFDDGDAEAIKLIYTEEERVFEGTDTISFEKRQEIVFYSKKGHFVRANIDDAENSEGNVILDGIVYQKIEEKKTASVADENLLGITMYPNPVKAGKNITLRSELSLKNNIVEIYNVNGQKIGSSLFTNINSNQYQAKIPENLSSGIYFYKVKNQQGSSVKQGKIKIE